jgi:hypothetical protein
MGSDDVDDPPSSHSGVGTSLVSVDMDLEEIPAAIAWQSTKNMMRTSPQNEATELVGKLAIGMQKIDEEGEEEEEEDIVGTKTRNWRQINLSFAVELKGQDGEDIRMTDYFQCTDPREGNNMPMKHHPIMSKIANFIAAGQMKRNAKM